MKVRIVSCKDSLFWYSKKIGEIIEIERETIDWYWAREGGSFNCLNIVDKNDVKLLSCDVEIVSKTKG